MNVISVKHVEDCFDGSFIKEVLFDDELDKNAVIKLAQHGSLKYYQDFARPFFKIAKKSCFEIKGVQGNKSIRLHLKNPENYTLEDFIDAVQR